MQYMVNILIPNLVLDSMIIPSEKMPRSSSGRPGQQRPSYCWQGSEILNSKFCVTRVFADPSTCRPSTILYTLRTQVWGPLSHTTYRLRDCIARAIALNSTESTLLKFMLFYLVGREFLDNSNSARVELHLL